MEASIKIQKNSRFYISTCNVTTQSTSSMANVDLNFPPTNNKNHSFDLNTIPDNSDDYDSGNEAFRDGGDSFHITQETNIESEEPVVRIISFSESTIVIDLNINPPEESNSQILELDADQLYEDSQDHLLGDQGKLNYYVLQILFWDPCSIIDF